MHIYITIYITPPANAFFVKPVCPSYTSLPSNIQYVYPFTYMYLFVCFIDCFHLVADSLSTGMVPEMALISNYTIFFYKK